MDHWNVHTAKPRLLIFSFEQLAHYLRCLTLAKQLASHFEVQVAHSPRYASFVEAAGFQTFSCEGLDIDAVLACVKKFDFSWLNLKNLEDVLNRQVAAIEKARPALVLGDTMPTLKMAAEKTGVPYVSLQNGYMTKHYAGVRTMSRRYPPYRYFRYLPKIVLDPITNWGERKTFYRIHRPFKILRRQYGVLKKFYYPDELEGDLNLICDLPELFPQRTLPGNYQFIPPLVYEPNAAPQGVLKKLNRSKRTLFVSMGSTGDWPQVSFLSELKFERYNIITAGDKQNVVRGPHVIALSFASARQVFPHVDLVLCHGGNGTIYQALLFGIPVLFKTAHFEQEWNAQAVQENGLGASLDHIKNTADYLKIIEAWVDKKGSEPLRRMQQKLETTNNFEIAIVHMKKLLPSATKTVYQEAEGKTT